MTYKPWEFGRKGKLSLIFTVVLILVYLLHGYRSGFTEGAFKTFCDALVWVFGAFVVGNGAEHLSKKEEPKQ